MTKNANFKRRVRARMAKTGETYSTARARLSQQEEVDSPGVGTVPSTLHVTNGDSTVRSLHQAGLAGTILAWRDILHEGPVPEGLSPQELRAARAEYIARQGFGSYDDILSDLNARDRLLHEHRQGEYVLWFEADLYDQLQLIQVLSTLRELGVPPDCISLVCIGEHRGIAHFGGLGELTGAQLAQLYPHREQLDGAALELAASAWRAFRSPDPRNLTDSSLWASAILRFVAEAFVRLAQEYPWHADGLSLNQRRILVAATDGASTMPAIFRHIMRKERRPYLGDTTCFAYIRELAAAHHPLLTIDHNQEELQDALRSITITDLGRHVLAGKADHGQMNGLDKWIGGVHLRSGASHWRYDERIEALTLVPDSR